MTWIFGAALASAGIALVAASPTYYSVSIEGLAAVTTPHIVIGSVNGRPPSGGYQMIVSITPNPPAGTLVHWSSPDHHNVFSETLHPAYRRDTLDVDFQSVVIAYPRDGYTGDAAIVATVGSPVLTSATLAVADRAAFGFGCYDFMPLTASVAFDHGLPQPSSFAASDVAELGLDPGPNSLFYGCRKEDIDPTRRQARLGFNHGGRIFEGPFVSEIPLIALEMQPDFDVRTKGGDIYRVHVTLSNSLYLEGWVEPLPSAMPAR